ncbi:MAG: hypothetical protein C0604_06050 [Clostridiales bacterium]|nr:MAG: hypothetical protein C0604_06050 [Clostridiales bacterium]
MKRLGLLFAIICLVQLSTGCFVVGARSPGDLMKSPSLKNDQQTIKAYIDEELLSGETLYKPENPDGMSAINFVDLDGDGSDEAVVYYKDGASYRLGAYVFAGDGGEWSLVSKIESSGVDISYSGFYDFTGNGDKEIVMAWSADKLDIMMNKYVSVYSYGEKIEELYHDSYTEMVVGDFYGNSDSEILLLNLDRNVSEPSSTGRLVAFSDGSFQVIDKINLDPYINGYYNVVSGPASADKEGIFIDMGIGAHSAATYLLVVEDGKIENVFSGDGSSFYSKTSKAYAVESMDINGDGIIEIGTYEEPYGNTFSMAETPWIINWHQWDGKNGLDLVMKSYINAEKDLRVDFPDAWKKGVTVGYSGDGSKDLQIRYVDENAGATYPVYNVRVIKDELLSERVEMFESEYFTAIDKSGNAYVVEKIYLDQQIPSSIKREYAKKILDDEEMKKIVKTWR